MHAHLQLEVLAHLGHRVGEGLPLERAVDGQPLPLRDARRARGAELVHLCGAGRERARVSAMHTCMHAWGACSRMPCTFAVRASSCPSSDESCACRSPIRRSTRDREAASCRWLSCRMRSRASRSIAAFASSSSCLRASAARMAFRRCSSRTACMGQLDAHVCTYMGCMFEHAIHIPAPRGSSAAAASA